jgi:hypothetical protein
MKQILTLFALTFAMASFAQNAETEATDSIAGANDPNLDQQLQEIVVQAPKVVHKSDMDVFYPSAGAVDKSKNGVQLLKNLMIPSLSVNEVMGTIKTSGESVQVRINGREATVDQVKSLLPETIKRIEWIDDPGLRYKGAVAVLNFIVANPSLGGSFMADAMPALNSVWGEYTTSLKLNNGRSQWGLNAAYKATNRIATHREYSETFTYENGDQLTRLETPLSGYMSGNFGYLQLDYSYIKPDTTTFWVAIHGLKEWNDDKLSDGLMTQSNGGNTIHLRDFSGNNGATPSIYAYFEQHFAHNQTIAIDFQSAFYNGKSYRTYTEHDYDTDLLLNDVNTSIKDHNQAYAVETDYIKKWNDSRLTVGFTYNANRNRSTYENLGGEVFHQRQDKTYFFAEYFQRIKKVSLSAGLGAQYTDFKFRETAQGNNSWGLRPKFSATYRYNPASTFSLSLTSWQNAPSLSQTNIAAQQTDGIQWRIGNPDLTTATSYLLTLRYKYTSDRISATFSVRTLDSPNAIAPYLYWDNDRLFTSYENSKGLKYATFTLSPTIDVIPNWLALEGSLTYRIEQSKGNGYCHHNRHLSGDATLTAYHWGFSLLAQYSKAQQTLSGELFDRGETLSVVMLSYDWRDWNFGAGAICPFTKYDTGSKSLNRYNTNKTNVRLDMSPILFLKITYNLQWGRQKRGVNKIIDADAQVDTSSAGGR